MTTRDATASGTGASGTGASGTGASGTEAPLPTVSSPTEAWRLMTAALMLRKQQLPELAAAFGLNPGALHALLSLDPDIPQSMSALAEGWRCDASNVTWLVDRLEERGLAERRMHATDRRVRTVVLTPKGVRARKEIEAQLHEAPESISALTPAELETLCGLLRKVVPDDGAPPSDGGRNPRTRF